MHGQTAMHVADAMVYRNGQLAISVAGEERLASGASQSNDKPFFKFHRVYLTTQNDKKTTMTMKTSPFFFFFLLSFHLHGTPPLRLASPSLETLDPRKVHSIAPRYVLCFLYEGLVRFEPDGKLHPAVAETIDISEDRKTYTFHLRHTCWSDGSPLVAEEFIEAWRESIASHPLYVKDWYFVKNGRQVVDQTLPFEELGVAAIDAKTIVIQLEKPIPYLLELLQDVSHVPVKKDIDIHFPHWARSFNYDYICNGPFRIQGGKEDNVLLLKKNPFYWDADSVFLQQIQFLITDSNDLVLDLFEVGELDWIGEPYNKMVDLTLLDTSNPLFSLPSAAVTLILCNTEHPLLKNVHLRKALAYAINREEFCKLRNRRDLPASTVLLPQYSCRQYVDKEENLVKARYHFQQFLEQEKQTTSTLRLLFSAAENRRNDLEFLQQQWKKNLGIDVEIEIREAKTWSFDVNRGNYQIAIGTLCLGRYDDSTEHLYHLVSSNPAHNLPPWFNSAFTQLVHAAEEQLQTSIRSTLLSWSEELLMEQMPQIPLFYVASRYAKNPHLQGEFLRNSNHIDLRWAFFNSGSN